MILTFFSAAALLGLPADYAWRRGRQLAPFGGLVTAAAVIGALAMAARVGLLHGPGAVADLIFGLITGGAVAGRHRLLTLGSPG